VRLKRLFIIVALAIVALAITGYAVLLTYDFNKLKPRIAKAVKAATGRELQIDGDIKLKLGLSPAVHVEHIRFQNASWGSRPDLARVKRMEIRVALLPLIRGHFEFVHLVMVEPDVIVETGSSGTSNFQFKTSNKQERALPVLIFQDVRIKKGLLTYKNGQSGDTHSVRFDSSHAVIPGLDKPMSLEFEGGFDDIPFALEGTVGAIAAWIKPDHEYPVKLTTRVGGASFNLKGGIRDPIHFKDLTFSVSAEGPSIHDVVKLAGVTGVPKLGAFKLKTNVGDPEGRLALDECALHVGSEESAAMSINGAIKDLLALRGINLDVAVRAKDAAKLTELGLPVPFPHGAFSASGRIFDPEGGLFSVKDLKVALGENEIDGQVDLNLTATPPYLAARLISKKFALGPFNLAVKLAGPTDRLALEEMDIQIGTEDLAVMQLNGAVDDLLKLDGVNVKFRVWGKDLANLKKFIDGPLPVQGSFNASGQVMAQVHKTFKIPKLAITVGKNHVNGSLDLDLRGQRPRLRAVLSSQPFDLSSVLTPEIAKIEWVKPLANLKTFRLAVGLAGFAKELSVADVDFWARTQQLGEVALKGAIDNLSALRGIHLDLAFRGENVANLEKLIGRPLPIRGAYAVSGHVSDPAANVYKAGDLKIVLGKNNLTGWMDVNLAGQQPKWMAELSTQRFNLKPLSISNKKVLTRLKKLRDLGPFKLKATVAGPAGKMALEAVDFCAGTEQLAEVRVKGEIKHLSALQGLDLKFSVLGNEVSKLTALTGQILPIEGTYAVSGKITDPSAKNYTVSDLKLILGKNKIAGWMDIHLSEKHMRLASELSAQRFNLRPISIPAIKPLARIPDLGPFNLALKLAGSGDKVAVENLDLDVGNQGLAGLVLKGKISDLLAWQGVKLEFAVRGNNLANLKKLGGPELPFQGPFNLSGWFVDPAPKIYKISSLKILIGDNDGSGSMELDLTKKRPKATIDMSSQKIDLRPLFVKIKKKDAAKGPASMSDKKKDKVFSSKQWSLDGLNLFDAHITVRPKQVLLRTLAFNDMRVDISLKSGNLSVQPIQFTIGGGSANGRFNLRSQDEPPSLDMALKVDQLDLGPMLDQLGYKRTLEGTLDTNITLTGRGNSLAQLMAGLNGRITLVMEDGQADSKYLDLVQRILGTDVLRLINPFKKKDPQTQVNCSVNDIHIKDGLAECKLLLDTDQTSTFGAGNVELGTEALDLRIKPVPKKGYGPDSVGKISFSFKELSQPFRLGGTLAQPSLALDTTGTIFFLGKFAGALALLGPIGIAAFFADVSLGKKNPCIEALKALDEEGKIKSGRKPEEKKKTDKETGLFRKER
jgi:uncharacterized protein involved in outer membrane biogenesis